MPGNPSNILHKCCHENDKGRLIISDKSQRYITHRIQNYMKNMKFYKKNDYTISIKITTTDGL